jgi:hypothetical protein
MRLPGLLILARYVMLLYLAVNWASVLHAGPATFHFTAELLENSDPSFPFPVGQKVSGRYTFELTTQGTTFPSPNTFTSYYDAITSSVVTLDGIGTATGSGGEIALADPVQYFGSYNFLADEYAVGAPVSGISISTMFGERKLVRFNIRLTDLDQMGIQSESLSATPPSLLPFLDHTGPNFDSDAAVLSLNFDYPSGATSAIAFRLTSLSVVPEPGAVLWAIALAGLAWNRWSSRITRKASVKSA